jgi:hypothetical protein
MPVLYSVYLCLQLSPIAQRYHDACAAHGSYVSPEISDQLGVSLATRALQITGVAITDAGARSIADTLQHCTHLTGK